ncbi:MAG: YdcF family protein [Butyrivibrio sp.]|nr:YdcF family protein [Butyrivibrio sp.]
MVITVVFGVLSVLCMAYYIVVISYAGTSSSFSAVWLLAAVLFAVAATAAFIIRRRQIRLPAALKAALAVLLAAAVIFFATVEGFIISGMNYRTESGLDYVIVLGARVRGTTITKSLAKRLEKALWYLESNPGTRAVVSGGRGDGEDISEAQAMCDYLIANGISEERIIMEDQSTNTEENIDFSMRLIGEDAGTDNPRIGVITNNFHVYRAVKICEGMGYCVNGIAAPSDGILFVNSMVREFFAVVKYKLSGAI